MTLDLLPRTLSQLDAIERNIRAQQAAVSTCFVYAPSTRPITTTCAYCRSHIATGPINCPNCGTAL